MFKQFDEPPVPSPIQSYAQTLDPPHFRRQLGSDSTDLNQRPGLHKASKPGRVLSDFTFQKSVDDSKVPPRKLKSPLIQSVASHRRTFSTLSETKESHPISIVSAIDAIVMPTSKVKIPKSSIGTSPTPRITPVSFESTLGPVCRSAIIRRQDSSIFIQSGDDAKEDQAPCSPSNTSILPRPKTTPSFPTRESSSEAMRQHFAEVRRVRKMTQLLGRELPPELVQVVDNRRERSRGRPDSTASSTSDCVPSNTTYESYTDVSEGGNTSPLTRHGTDFQERRRRITKLSEFFGVRHADLASVVAAKPKHHCATSSIFSQKSVSFDEPTRVGIKVISRKRFGSGEDMREVELGDAIDKLRCLKAN